MALDHGITLAGSLTAANGTIALRQNIDPDKHTPASV